METVNGSEKDVRGDEISPSFELREEVKEKIAKGQQITYGEILHCAKAGDGHSWEPTTKEQLYVCAMLSMIPVIKSYHIEKGADGKERHVAKVSTDCHRVLNGHSICEECPRYVTGKVVFKA